MATTAAGLSVRISANIGDFEKEMASLERSLDRTGSRFQSVGSKLTTGLTLPIVALAGTSVKAAVDFESSFAGVRKTVNATEAQLAQLSKGLRDMSKVLPVSVNELNRIAEAAGQLGIKRDNILSFTKVIADMSVSTNMTADAAAVSMARIANITQMPQEEFSNLGSVIVELGNNLATTESEITEFGLRIAGAGSIANMSVDQIMAIGAAMSSVGVQAEAGGTAVQKVLLNMVEAVSMGGKQLEQFGAVSGLGGAFGSTFKQDPSGAFLAFVEGLGKAGDAAIPMLQGLGLNDERLIRAFLSLAGAGDVLRNSLTLASGAWKDNSALATEAGKRYLTTASQFQILKNKAMDVGISLGQVLIPALLRMMPAIETILGAVAGAVNWFSQLPQPVQTTGIAFVGLLAAIGPVSYAIGTLIKTASALIPMFRALASSSAIGAIAPSVLGARAAISGFAAAAVATPYGAIAAGVIGIGAAFALIGPKIREAVREFGIWGTVKQSFLQSAHALPFIAPLVSGGLGSGSASATRPGRAVGKDINLPVDPAQQMQREFDQIFKQAIAAPVAAAARRANQFSGADVFKAADAAMDDLKAIGGLTKLTADETEDLNRKLTAALDKYTALGRVGPQAMYDTWLATSLVKVQSGLPGGIGQQLPLMNMADATLAGYQNTVPVGSGIAGIGQQLPLPTAPAPPGFFESAFGSMKDFGTNLSQTIMSALTGGGDLGKSLGGFLGGGLLDELGKKLSGMGGMLGGALGNLFGPLGSLLGSQLGKLFDPLIDKVKTFFRNMFSDPGRDLVEDFAKEFATVGNAFGKNNGFDNLHAQLLEMGDAGEQLWKKLTQGVGRDNPEQAKAVIEEVRRALEEWPETVRKATESLTGGVNARSVNITGQADLDVVGAGATAAFALMIQQGQSAIEAFNALTPSITAMRDALAAGNLTATESVARMLEIGAVLDANKIQFDNIAASGQILSAMLQGNIRDAGLFGAVAGDIGTQIQAVIDKGVPMAQVFALAQPQLQAIWEAQQKWGFAVDDTTAALLAEAEAQGFVGAQMQSVNQQILNVLIAIGNVLGADIPAALGALPGHAQAAADGMNAAFDGIKGPDIGGGGWQPGDPVPVVQYGANDVPQMASGGIVRARPGGTLVNVGEGGRDEAIVPIGGRAAGGGTVVLEIDGERFARILVPYIPDEVQRYGAS